ncbi:PD-(D/E)XK nuclease family protein [Pseudarthrobacter sp. fls2-241-R2A-127]|uniref:PD-(D/E)XK nuclease family protein n=1 Tax=Pseudarthrobacter sp. fls2-241-R2A-127 TaxID=3040303 RepID=UPI0033068225
MYCLASGVASASAPVPRPASSFGTDIGSMAHRALERWTRQGIWVEDEDGSLLRRGYELEGLRSGIKVNEEPGGRLLGMRVRNLGRSLRERLSAVAPNKIFPEEAVRDSASGIRGVIDLLIIEEETAHVYDYKTGRNAVTAAKLASDSVRTQMTAYGLVVSRLYPDRQLHLAVVSPSQGIVEVPFDEEYGRQIVDRVQEFALLSEAGRDQLAKPDSSYCYYCPRRLRCEPQWQAALTAGWADVVAGEVVDKRVSDNKRLSYAVNTGQGLSWVLDASPERTEGLEGSSNSYLRGVRLNRVYNEDGVDVHYRARADTELMLSSQPLMPQYLGDED